MGEFSIYTLKSRGNIFLFYVCTTTKVVLSWEQASTWMFPSYFPPINIIWFSKFGRKQLLNLCLCHFSNNYDFKNRFCLIVQWHRTNSFFTKFMTSMISRVKPTGVFCQYLVLLIHQLTTRHFSPQKICMQKKKYIVTKAKIGK